MNTTDDASEPGDAVALWIERCRRSPCSTLDSVESPAEELMAFAAGDRHLMESARKVILAGLDAEPGDPTLSQMLSFWRRAFEKGTWSWEPNPWDASPMLTS